MAQKPHKRVSRISQSIDFSPPKGQLSGLEKELQELIDSLNNFLDQQKTRHKDDTTEENTLEENLTTLRQHMRSVRRWRNGSVPCGPVDCDILTDYLHKTYRKLLTKKAKALTEELKQIDEFILILDEDSNDLRQNMDDDIQNLEKRIASFEGDGASTGKARKTSQEENSSLCLYKETDVSIKELQEAVEHLNFKIQENNNKLGENLSIQTTSTPVKPASTSSKGNHKSFEMNPARNRVLATADNIRRILRSLKAGGHLPMGSTNKKQIQNCADNDIEVLRRQLRKVRRWQQSLEEFFDEDVDDLHLIVSAIERHIGEDEGNARKPADSTSHGKSVTSDRQSPSLNKSNPSPITKSTKSISSSDTDSYTGPPSTDSEAPPSYEDACYGQITIKSSSVAAVADGVSQADDNLDENLEFSERLI